ncbi:MAG: glycyl-radical enzyme activating protein [Planctomycetota bacterium]|jgi:pyruvate formate lyase activating enzyme|nr:glycyl-radical enzyme activating protein [Planctomycetota bacterium]
MIFNIQRCSLHDGEGVRTVVFMKGCPLRCPWCSNPEGQSFGAELLFAPEKCIGCRDCMDAARNGEIRWNGAGPVIDRAVVKDAAALRRVCPAEAMTVAGEDRAVEGIIAEAEKDKVFYRGKGGVTLSGGEPFAQPELALNLLRAARERGLTAAAETCLDYPWENIEPALPLLDRILADVKHVDARKYNSATGGDAARALGNFRRLAGRGKPVAARVPVIPGFNADGASLAAIAGFVADAGARSMHLLPYHSFGEGKYALLGRAYPLAGIRNTPPESLEPIAQELASTGLHIIIGG